MEAHTHDFVADVTLFTMTPGRVSLLVPMGGTLGPLWLLSCGFEALNTLKELVEGSIWVVEGFAL